MATGTSGEPMWQCSGCKQWIPYNQSHICGSYKYPQQQYYTYQPYIDPSVLERIAKALEAIASQLKLLVAQPNVQSDWVCSSCGFSMGEGHAEVCSLNKGVP